MVDRYSINMLFLQKEERHKSSYQRTNRERKNLIKSLGLRKSLFFFFFFCLFTLQAQ